MTRLESVWSAVLQLSIEDAAKGPSEQELKDYTKVRQADAREWIESNAQGPGTFLWVCEMLGLEPAGVRKAVTEKRSGKK